ncbi:MupG family TIM beta-alpha barrel fold protein [Companilactobacillus halodurans]|uniref:MupG family TIM beta-alpha barrel fold protein n=1 Tax=Companilactobacillus halodurans TaxID=2584183 RepID=UPI001297F0C6|nr:MupG family TIM beta-alpha barrel fold protein [Companilactobacillus halodurans]
MLGFSFYLDHTLDQDDKNYIESMKQHHFNEIFTSLHIPEENQALYTKRLQDLLKVAKKNDLKVFVDIDQNSLANLPNELDGFYLRLDDGFSNQDIAEMSQTNPLALNASTLTKDDIKELQKYQADFKNIEAWHNFYPRPETGLDFQWFLKKNQWFKSLGITTQAFIPGDEKLRGPINAGLPTLEDQRNNDRLASAIQLTQANVDKVFIGDPRLSLTYQEEFADYFNNNVLDLTLKANDNIPQDLLNQILHNRPDPAAKVVRVLESRQMNQRNQTLIAPNNNIPRNIGSITIDNQAYGRYMGEVQLTKTDLPLDKKVNVIGHLDTNSIQLLPYITANSAFKLIPKE